MNVCRPQRTRIYAALHEQFSAKVVFNGKCATHTQPRCNVARSGAVMAAVAAAASASERASVVNKKIMLFTSSFVSNYMVV